MGGGGGEGEAEGGEGGGGVGGGGGGGRGGRGGGGGGGGERGEGGEEMEEERRWRKDNNRGHTPVNRTGKGCCEKRNPMKGHTVPLCLRRHTTNPAHAPSRSLPPNLHQGLLWQLGGLEGDGAPHVGRDWVCEAVARAGGALEAIQIGARLRVTAGEGPGWADRAGGAWHRRETVMDLLQGTKLLTKLTNL